MPSSALHLCEQTPVERINPFKFLGVHITKELKAFYPLHRCLVDGDGCVHLLSVGCLIVVSDQAYHRCVISKFDDDIGAVCSCTVVCVQGVQEWAEDATLRSTSDEDQGR